MSKLNKTSYDITRIIKDEYTEKDWQEYFEFRTVCAKKVKSELHLKTWEELRRESLGYFKKDIGIYTIRENGKEAGYFLLDLRIKHNAKKRFTYLTPYFVSENIDDTLLKMILIESLNFDPLSNYLTIQSKNSEYDYIGKRLKYEIITDQVYLELEIEKANKKVIGNWVKTYSKKFSNLTMKFYEEIPEELLKEFCKVFKEFLNDRPANSKRGIITVDKIRNAQKRERKLNYTSYRYLIFSEENKLIAMTNIQINKNEPKSMYQYMTGVLKEYRGLGLGKWLKGTMFKKLEKDFPELEIIQSDTNVENHGSKSLNYQIGYQQVSTLKEFKISREEAEAFVKGKRKVN